MVTIKKISRKRVYAYENVVDFDGFYTFLKGGGGKVVLLEPIKQLKEIGDLLTTKCRATIISLDTVISLMKEIYGLKSYKRKFFNLILLLAMFEKLVGGSILFLLYSEKLINRILTAKSNKAIYLQLVEERALS